LVEAVNRSDVRGMCAGLKPAHGFLADTCSSCQFALTPTRGLPATEKLLSQDGAQGLGRCVIAVSIGRRQRRRKPGMRARPAPPLRWPSRPGGPGQGTVSGNAFFAILIRVPMVRYSS
jgi:hypothetical protein